MSATTVAASEPVREEAGLATAYRLLLLVVVFDFLAFGVGMQALTGVVDLSLRARIR